MSHSIYLPKMFVPATRWGRQKSQNFKYLKLQNNPKESDSNNSNTYMSAWKWNFKQQESGPYEISSNSVSVSNSI